MHQVELFVVNPADQGRCVIYRVIAVNYNVMGHTEVIHHETRFYKSRVEGLRSSVFSRGDFSSFTAFEDYWTSLLRKEFEY